MGGRLIQSDTRNKTKLADRQSADVADTEDQTTEMTQGQSSTAPQILSVLAVINPAARS